MIEMSKINPNEEYLALVQRTKETIQSKKKFDTSLAEAIANLPQDRLPLFVGEVVAALAGEKKGVELMQQFGQMLAEIDPKLPPELENTKELLSKLQEEAKNYFELTKNDPPSTTMTVKMQHFLDTIISLLDGFLLSIGLSDIFDPSDDSATKSRKITLLLGLIFTVSAILIPLIGLTHGAIVIGAIALGVIAFGVIYPKIQPLPRHIFLPTDNWSFLYKWGDLKTSKVIPKELSDLTKKLKKDQPVLIHGPTGVGKTELIHSFVKKVEDGEVPHLKGKRIFYINAGAINPDKLQSISKNMGRHREELIVVFDNLNPKDTQVLSELKTMLEGKTHFPYFIGISTEKMLLNQGGTLAMASASEKSTKEILQETHLPEDVIDHLISSTHQKIQPGTALRILDEALPESEWKEALPQIKKALYELTLQAEEKDKNFLLFLHEQCLPALEKVFASELKSLIDKKINE